MSGHCFTRPMTRKGTYIVRTCFLLQVELDLRWKEIMNRKIGGLDRGVGGGTWYRVLCDTRM